MDTTITLQKEFINRNIKSRKMRYITRTLCFTLNGALIKCQKIVHVKTSHPAIVWYFFYNIWVNFSFKFTWRSTISAMLKGLCTKPLFLICYILSATNCLWFNIINANTLKCHIQESIVFHIIFEFTCHANKRPHQKTNDRC